MENYLKTEIKGGGQISFQRGWRRKRGERKFEVVGRGFLIPTGVRSPHCLLGVSSSFDPWSVASKSDFLDARYDALPLVGAGLCGWGRAKEWVEEYQGTRVEVLYSRIYNGSEGSVRWGRKKGRVSRIAQNWSKMGDRSFPADTDGLSAIFMKPRPTPHSYAYPSNQIGGSDTPFSLPFSLCILYCRTPWVRPNCPPYERLRIFGSKHLNM